MNRNERSLSYRFKQIHDSAEADINRVLQKYDLTLSQISVLGVLFEADGPLMPREIEGMLGLAHPTVIGLLRRLELKGFVENIPCPGDRRCRNIRLTAKAREGHKHMAESERSLNERLVRGMTSDQVNTLLDLLERVRHNLSTPMPGENLHAENRT